MALMMLHAPLVPVQKQHVVWLLALAAYQLQAVIQHQTCQQAITEALP